MFNSSPIDAWEGAGAIFNKVVAGVKLGGFVNERVAIFHHADFVAFERLYFLYVLPAARFGDGRKQRALDDE